MRYVGRRQVGMRYVGSRQVGMRYVGRRQVRMRYVGRRQVGMRCAINCILIHLWETCSEASAHPGLFLLLDGYTRYMWRS